MAVAPNMMPASTSANCQLLSVKNTVSSGSNEVWLQPNPGHRTASALTAWRSNGLRGRRRPGAAAVLHVRQLRRLLTNRDDVERRDRPAEPLENDVSDRLAVDVVLDLGTETLLDQDLPTCCFGRESEARFVTAPIAA